MHFTFTSPFYKERKTGQRLFLYWKMKILVLFFTTYFNTWYQEHNDLSSYNKVDETKYRPLQSHCRSAAISSFTITLWKSRPVKRETETQLLVGWSILITRKLKEDQLAVSKVFLNFATFRSAFYHNY